MAMRTDLLSRYDEPSTDQLADERSAVIATRGLHAWREHVIEQVTALLARHYPATLVAAEIADVTRGRANPVAHLEALLVRLRYAERSQSVRDRYHRV